MAKIDDGGHAYPGYEHYIAGEQVITGRPHGGMSLRDYFAGHVQADDRLVKVVRAMDDTALELFALHPNCEREDWVTSVDLTCWAALPSEVAKVARRLELEAAAIARVRYMQADALLRARTAQSPAGERQSPSDIQAQHLAEFGKL